MPDSGGMAGAKLDTVAIPTTLLIDPHGEDIGRLVVATRWDSPEMADFLKEVIELSKEVSL
ncbi:hypothetical protein GCM10023342_09390 [Modicisalibacter zincidurans]|uniref:TlpA family protein disulfide reductase n=2 Tax=Modicisalibacter zincidurans TaxID=1178777 RepID=A0ABP9R857_9GAMM